MEQIEDQFPLEPVPSDRPGPSTNFTFADGAPGGVGFISSVSQAFCTTCNRLRLSTSGALHACLAYDDAVDLRGPLRAAGADAVAAAIRGALAAKRPGHTFQLIGLGGPRKAMIQIGG